MSFILVTLPLSYYHRLSCRRNKIKNCITAFNNGSETRTAIIIAKDCTLYKKRKRLSLIAKHLSRPHFYRRGTGLCLFRIFQRRYKLGIAKPTQRRLVISQAQISLLKRLEFRISSRTYQAINNAFSL